MGRARRNQRDAQRKQRAAKRKSRLKNSEDSDSNCVQAPAKRSKQEEVVEKNLQVASKKTGSTVDSDKEESTIQVSEGAQHEEKSTEKAPIGRIERMRLKKQQQKARRKEKKAARESAAASKSKQQK
jgi:hypothetical protein